MGNHAVYNLLEQPWLYRLTQRVLAPGGGRNLTEKFKHILTQLPAANSILDVGCGPSSWLWRVGLHPIGIDISSDYMAAFGDHAEPGVVGSAAALPFPDGSFDGVWTIGLLHHLPDGIAYQTVCEMLRVCRKGGYIVIFDAVMPASAWRRPVAYALRRLDRGKFVRRESEFKTILSPMTHPYTIERITYSSNGLEGILICALCT